MKHLIWCVLFGHKFGHWNRYSNGSVRFYTFDYCVKCGLTKEDLALTSSDKTK
jgi:hypothetical protein